MSARLELKICGVRDVAALHAAVDAGADMVGFMFFAPSPRNLDLEAAADLVRMLPPSVEAVAVTVDADDALIDAIAKTVQPAWFQAHGKEPPARVGEIARVSGRPVIKALPVRTADDLAAADAYAGPARRVLFDAKPPKDATRPGGLGVAFDWTLLAGYRAPVAWMLSGGLTVETVGEAVQVSGASAVDVSSGVERELGVKDPVLIRAFIAAARARDEPVGARA